VKLQIWAAIALLTIAVIVGCSTTDSKREPAGSSDRFRETALQCIRDINDIGVLEQASQQQNITATIYQRRVGTFSFAQEIGFYVFAGKHTAYRCALTDLDAIVEKLKSQKLCDDNECSVTVSCKIPAGVAIVHGRYLLHATMNGSPFFEPVIYALLDQNNKAVYSVNPQVVPNFQKSNVIVRGDGKAEPIFPHTTILDESSGYSGPDFSLQQVLKQSLSNVEHQKKTELENPQNFYNGDQNAIKASVEKMDGILARCSK